MNRFFDTKEDIRQAVRLRLLVATAEVLPTDGSAGPRPFDIEPLEKWLYEGFARHYVQDETRKAGFWFGVADSLLEAIPPIDATRVESVKRCASLLEQIANNFGVAAIQVSAMGEILKRHAVSIAPSDLASPEALKLQVALLRIFILLSEGSPIPQLLQLESDTWRSIYANLVSGQVPVDAMLYADALCVLFRAWATMGRRNPADQAIVSGWCQSQVMDTSRVLAHMKRAHILMKSSGAHFFPAIWAALESCVSGERTRVEVKRLGIPRFIPVNSTQTQPLLAIA
jgi:hypothetical protein